MFGFLGGLVLGAVIANAAAAAARLRARPGVRLRRLRLLRPVLPRDLRIARALRGPPRPPPSSPHRRGRGRAQRAQRGHRALVRRRVGRAGRAASRSLVRSGAGRARVRGLGRLRSPGRTARQQEVGPGERGGSWGASKAAQRAHDPGGSAEGGFPLRMSGSGGDALLRVDRRSPRAAARAARSRAPAWGPTSPRRRRAAPCRPAAPAPGRRAGAGRPGSGSPPARRGSTR